MSSCLAAQCKWNLSSKDHFHWGIQSVLLTGKKTLTQLTVLELFSASKGLQQTAARWWTPTHILTHTPTHCTYPLGIKSTECRSN